MNDTHKVFAIGVLAITAVLLLGTVLVLDRIGGSAALAGNTPDRQGDYIMIVGSHAQGDEVVYIIDVASQKMGVYQADANNNKIVARAALNLGTIGGSKKDKDKDK